MNEREIIRLLCSRDEKGIDELLRHFGPLLRYVIAPILPNAQDGEECISETALRVWNGIDGFDGARGSFPAWLTAVARNTAINHARRAARGGEGDIPEDTPSPKPAPEQELLLRERREALSRALDRLGAGERALFYRKYYYMQPTVQIAAETGMSERAVEGRLYRLKKRLRDMLGGEGYGKT